MWSRLFSSKSSSTEEAEEHEDQDSASLTSDGAGTSVDDEASFQQHENEEKSSQDNPLLPEELCQIPTFLNTASCDKELVEETRRLLKKKFAKRPDSFSESDYNRMLEDDWTVSRFLLRCRLNPKRSARLMEQCGKFRKEYRMGTSKMSDFPIEFHRAGGLFRYAPDRVGNQTIYMRAKMHRRIPELSQVMKEFILCCLEECDKANSGRGTAVIFDITNASIMNADPGFLFWLVYSFRNYCPKGLSYIIVYNLPWMWNATAKLAMSWLSSTNKRRLRFVSGRDIETFIAPENLPDFMGGTCKLDYRHVPEGSKLCDDPENLERYNFDPEQSKKIRELYAKFLKEIDGNIEIIDPNDRKDDKNSGNKDTTANILSSSVVAS